MPNAEQPEGPINAKIGVIRPFLENTMRQLMSTSLVLVFGLSAVSGCAALEKLTQRQDAQATVPALMDGPVAEVKELGAQDLSASTGVDQGIFACEDGGSVSVSADANEPGHFTLAHKGKSYSVSPRVSVTGALRLEDTAGSVVWLQLANKSMLLAPKQSRRLADGCMSENQKMVAAELKNAPAVSLFDPEPATAVAQQSSSQAAAAIMGGD